MAVKKEERAVTFELDTKTGTVTFTNADKDTCIVKLANMSQDAQVQAGLFGVARKVTNVLAPMKDATPAEKWEAIQASASRLNTGGDWNGEKGEGAGQLPILEVAMLRVYGDTPAKVKATLDKTMAKKGWTEQKKAIAYWLATEKVALAVLEIKKERLVGKKSTADDDLDDLRG